MSSTTSNKDPEVTFSAPMAWIVRLRHEFCRTIQAQLQHQKLGPYDANTSSGTRPAFQFNATRWGIWIMEAKLYVGYLLYETSEEDLCTIFDQLPRLVSRLDSTIQSNTYCRHLLAPLIFRDQVECWQERRYSAYTLLKGVPEYPHGIPEDASALH